MSNSKPVSYLASQCIVKHFDPMLRFQLSAISPSNQALRKSTPTHFEYLKITDNMIQVNHLTFQLSVIKRTNPYPGYLFDINQYGRLDLDEIEQDPNEVRIDGRSDPELEKLVQGTQSFDMFSFVQAEYRKSLAIIKRYVPSVNYIKLIVGGKVEVLSYGRKMHEAMYYLLGRLFGGRNFKVDRLAIGCETILRIPKTVKFFDIQVLDVLDQNVNASRDGLSQIIDASCLPLPLAQFWFSKAPITVHPIMEASQRLVFQAPTANRLNLHRIANLNHRRIHVPLVKIRMERGRMERGRMERRGMLRFKEIVDQWIIYGKEIGTYYTCEMPTRKIREEINDIRRYFEDRVDERFPHDSTECTLNMNNTSNIVVKRTYREHEWVLGMRVVNRNHF